MKLEFFSKKATTASVDQAFIFTLQKITDIFSVHTFSA